ncbi:hypothetical protein NP233_g5324 [Leucocoprinus birnbaumii]|uniref:N-acetyltransferase domain-containing protein n=1 Tax=Leucocoprinus birnbaumii TaxID=56174 RepID=A0AAD5YWI9_9AGAR|nr:hypothetical protein NP233_g5324 [Leucocoprinus birnbaumii]
MTMATAFIRVAREDDYEEVSDVIVESFLHDPLYNYYAALKDFIPRDRGTKEKDNLRRWSSYLLNLCNLAGGRVTVLVEHSGEKEERIVGVAEWLPPYCRPGFWDFKLMLKAGLIGMIRAWGITGLMRSGFEWLDDGSEQKMLKEFRQQGYGNAEEAWYLLQIAVRPECQGRVVQGYMSKLLQEAFEHAPNAVFTTDATSAKARDRYKHFGYEVVGVLTVGKGKCDTQGLEAKGDDAAGVNSYSLVRMPSDWYYFASSNWEASRITPMTTGTPKANNAKTTVRLATEADFEAITDVVVNAFVHDPVYNYFGSLKELIPKDKNTKEKDNLRRWAYFLLNMCVLGGGRITVLVEHPVQDNEADRNDNEYDRVAEEAKERIVGFAEWMPPNKRVALWHVRTMYKAGILGMLRVWGFNGLMVSQIWYMSKLIREGFDHEPSAIFTLDATTAGSRDKYAHVGFETVGVVPLGKGKSNTQGLQAKGDLAVGIDAYSMVKLPSLSRD